MTEAFTALRPRLFGIAYRMVGRVAEAEDLVQETWVRWQRQAATEVRSAEAWLVATVTRLAIDHLRSARRQREEYYGVWLPEPLVEPAERRPDETAALADSLTMAFMLMLETLTPDERAVFLLREVFDRDYGEIAGIVGKSEANCRQIVRRAKASLAGRDAGTAAPSERAREIVARFLRATATGEVGDLVALLTDDAVLYTDGGGKVASAGRPIRSADHIGRFFVGIRSRSERGGRGARPEFAPVWVNGRPGALVRMDGRLDRAVTFDFAGERICAIYIVRNPEKLRHVAEAAGGVTAGGPARE